MEAQIEDAVRKGVYMPRPFADELRRGCKKRGYNQSAVIRIALEEQFLKKWREEDTQETAA